MLARRWLLRSPRVLALVAFVAVIVAIALFALQDATGEAGGTFPGKATVQLTEFLGASGEFQSENIFADNTRQIIAVIQVVDAHPGMKVTGRWYRAGLAAPADYGGIDGHQFDQASFTMNSDIIDQDTRVGGGSMTLNIRKPLPSDAYIFRLYVDGKLAKVAPFVLIPPR